MRHCTHVLRRFVILLTVLAGGPLFAATVQPTGHAVDGEVLVKIQPAASQADVATIRQLGDVDDGEKIASTRSGTIWRMHSRTKNVEALTAALQHNPNIAYVEPNYLLHLAGTPNDALYAQLWGLKNTGQTAGGQPGFAGSDINAEAAWNVTTGSNSIVVGVVDTGVDYTHPDLAANIWNNPGGKGNALCAAGTHGYNAITKTCNPMDDYYHGTHVAGTIGAVGNNGIGVAGVNWTTSIMALKFLSSSGSGTTADAIAAIDFAVQAKIDGVNVRVLSNSWGGGAFSKALLDEINKAGENDILFVAAAGNDAVSNDLNPHYPANYATANMISVAAMDNRDALAYFSDWGQTTVHLGAPGVNILSTFPGGSYSSISGTSMAAPHVSGVAALVLAKTPSLTTAQVKSAILDNTDPVTSLAGKTITGGRLNAARALGVPPSPAFNLVVGPSSRTVTRGASVSYVVSVTPLNGFAGSVGLTVTGLPPNTTASFTPASTATTSTLTVTTADTTPLTSNSLTVTGVSGAITRMATMTLTVSATAPVTACPSLSYYSYYYLATSDTSALAAGDFNRDGIMDFIAASAISNRVSLLLGGGIGFQTAQTSATGTNPVGVAVADFNGDGKLDAATANSGSNNVSVLLGNGDGSFGTSNYDAGTSPFAVAAGDVNGDGKLDLVTANNGSNNVSVLLGNGDGTFQPALPYGTGSGPFGLAIGDFDRDGNPDLAVAVHRTAKVSVLLGNGDGTFDAAVDYTVGSGPASVAVADFNGDGKSDLATANDQSNNVSILLGVGDGTFGAAVHSSVGTAPDSIAAADFNGDGKADLLTANVNSANVSLLSGNGNGTFQAAVNYSAPQGATQLAVGDFNRDGRLDAVTGAPNYYIVSLLLNGGLCSLNCSTMAAAVPYAAGTVPVAHAAGDFDRDGIPDLAVANSGSNNVSVLRGNGDGTFQAAANFGAGTTPRGVAAGDFNGDGKLDLATANIGSDNVSILLGNGNATFQSAVNYGAGTDPRSIAVADFNRDGKLDLAVANSGSNNVSRLLGNGDGTFQAAVQYAAGTSAWAIAAGDFNRDGRIDLAVANSGSNNVSILRGNADGTFQAATNFNVGTTPYALVVADFDRDGKADLAVADSGSNDVSILLGNGSGSFGAATSYATGTTPYGLAAADFDDDGKLDLAVANNGSGSVSILAGTGTGAFIPTSEPAAGTAPASIVAADFNRDGKPDVTLAQSGADKVAFLANTCPAPDLTAVKTHSGSFTQGSTGKTYTITVTNSGNAATSGAVTMADLLPAGLTATDLSGTGWTCTKSTVSCTRSDSLAAGGSYPAITLTVKVATNTAASVTNTAIASGGGQLNTLNDAATDPTTITPVTDLIVLKTHSGNFTQGASGRTYTIVAKNAGGLATSGTVTVTDTLPAGLSATAIAGTGWSCVLGTLTCTRSDALAGGGSYPPISVTVNVAANAAAQLVNTATVSGGGDAVATDNSANDPTIVWASQNCGGFSSSVILGNTGNSYVSVARDFNGDGKTDLAAADSYNSRVTVFLGNGNGTFAAGVNYTVGDSPASMVADDMNGDGNVDLVVLNRYSYSISILAGNGDGTFNAAVHTVYGSAYYYAYSLVTGDFNGDGNRDAAFVYNSYTGLVLIFLGNGNGTLQPAVTYPAGNYPFSAAVSDLDNDGKLDLVVGTSYGNVQVLLGNGDGSFKTPIATTAPASVYVTVGDFNGDGKADVAGTYSSSTSLSVLLGAGNGTFAAPVNYSVGFDHGPILADDLNGDGKVDLIAPRFYSYTATTLRGNGDGTFQAPVSVYTGFYSPNQILLNDFNGDGRPDLALVNGYVATALGGCPDLTITKSHAGNFSELQSGTYTLAVTNAGIAATNGSVTVTDTLPVGLTPTSMTGSGWSCTLGTASCTRSDILSGGQNFPNITLTVNVASSTAASITNIATVTGGGEINTGNNVAADPTTVTHPFTRQKTPADFNGNGTSDFVIYRGGAWVNYSGAPSVWTGEGSSNCIPAPGDYDGNGVTDYSLYCGGAWVFYNANGTFRQGIWTGAVPGDLPVPADYDGDGDDDVMIYRNGTWILYDFNTGATLSVITTPITGGIPLPMDYDGDHRAELTVYKDGAWHFFNDNGTYLKGLWIGNTPGNIPVPGDYDGNGVEELVIFNNGGWHFYDFNSGAYIRGVLTPYGGTAGAQPAPLDYDGDGSVDFTVFVAGAWHIWNDNGSYRGGLWIGDLPDLQPLSRRQHINP